MNTLQEATIKTIISTKKQRLAPLLFIIYLRFTGKLKFVFKPVQVLLPQC
jgi:hypothetical protein